LAKGEKRMLALDLDRDTGEPLQVLCLGAHSDDIEIGCGGTLMQLAAARKNATFHWIVFSAESSRNHEARRSAALFLQDAPNKNIVVKDFRTSFFPYTGLQIKEYFEEIKATISPDVIFTHSRGDLHQDHRVLHELTWNTFRDHLILEYEICKYDGDLGRPNAFVHLSADTCQRKVDYILQCFETQKSKHWFTNDMFYSIMRIRGMESNSPSGYAEAFYARKMVVSCGSSCGC
jgi:LmbE family N-acetylglucosaminyl deacetylase